ncbi:hypothetical protein GTP56_25085 [Duganella sp. FT134W]|uniref:Uncharacterized protein n=1 Tax=Duganella margarita TaxID=2692170 RepID=A0A7X4H6W8_9BURK|nr:hypothetical protein [Duganella margarita]MYM75449.1 hypothetical protein [Duganella margarita]
MTQRQTLAFFVLLPLFAFAATVPLQKEMSFTAARKLLLKEKWRPVNVHAHDDYVLMGVEHELAKMNMKEFDSCSIDFSNCIMRYKRGNECLSVFTIGEKIKYMKVVDWTDECPPPTTKPSSEK